MATKQEDKNRKLLEELNRTRQLMMKNSGASKSTGGGDGAQNTQATRVDPRALQLLQSLEKQSAITFIPTNSQFGNLVLPVFPRFTAPPAAAALDDSDNKS